MTDDELLITKWLMVGGVLWTNAGRFSRKSGSADIWFAIERGKDENTTSDNTNAHDAASAIRLFLEKFGRSHAWCEPLLREYGTSSCLGPTSPHTAR
jgi:hypothetical protein